MIGIVFWFAAIIMACEPNQNTTKNEQSSAEQRQATFTLPNNSIPYYQAGRPQNDSPQWYAALKWPEWLLVFIAAITALAVWYQAKETARAAKATEIAANAAKDNATALINSERAWVIAELVPICAKFGSWWHRRAGSGWAVLTGEEVLSGEHLKHRLKLTNMGRTPAHVLSFRIGYSCLLEGVTVLPEGTSGDIVEKHPFDHLLATGAAIEVLEPTIDVDKFRRDSIKQVGDSKKIEDAKWTLVFHGWVEYLHVFSEKSVRELFCYVYIPSLQRLRREPAEARK